MKQIISYQAIDGVHFDTEEECLKRDLVCELFPKATFFDGSEWADILDKFKVQILEYYRSEDERTR